MRKSTTVKAVYDSDLQELLRNLGILDKLIAGELSCAVCGCSVDLDNLGTIFPLENDISVSCDNERCVRTITTRGAATLSG